MSRGGRAICYTGLCPGGPVPNVEPFKDVFEFLFIFFFIENHTLHAGVPLQLMVFSPCFVIEKHDSLL